MTLDTRWKFPQGKTPEQLYDAIYQIVRELRKGDIPGAPAGVTNEQLADMAQATIKGRAAGAGTGDPQDLTADQVRAITNPGLVLLASGTVTNAATLDIVLTGFTAHRALKFVFTELRPATDATIFQMQTSSDGGQNFDAGAMQGALARWFRDTNASIDASGAANAFAITSNRTISAYADDLQMAFTANFTITGAATLSLNGLGAKDIVRFNGQALTAGDIVSGQPVWVIYKAAADDWFMVSAAAALFANMHADFNENATPGNPAANVARVYAKDVSGLTLLAFRDSAGTERVLDVIGKSELVAIIEDRKAQGVAPQTLTGGVDNIRELNTLVFNRNSLVSLSSNRFTLPAGTWEVGWVSPIIATATAQATHQSFLFNQTDSTEVARGTSGVVDADGSNGQDSNGRTVVTIALPKAFEIRHQASDSRPGGKSVNFGTEVYTRVNVRRA